MTQKKIFPAVSAISALIFVVHAHAQSNTRAIVEKLASPQLEGRLTGTIGEKLASDFLVAELEKIGAKPLPGQKDLLLPLEFTAGTKDGGSTITTTGENKRPARALSFSDNGDVTGDVVFAGYGIVVPETQGFGYDSYATLDVKDKVVLVLRYFPEDADQKTRGILARYADLRYKAMAARQRGAKAMLIVTGPRSPNARELLPMTFDTALAGPGLRGVRVHGGAAAPAVHPTGQTPAGAQQTADD